MKICILTPRFPFPENGGDVLRINYIARYLKEKGHQLLLVSFHENSPCMEESKGLYDKIYTVKRNCVISAFQALRYLFTRRPIQCGYYYSPLFMRLFERVVADEAPDLYVSHLLRMTTYLEKKHLEHKSIVEMTDALSKTYMMSKLSNGRLFIKTIYKIEQSLIRRYEQYTIEHFPKVVLVSQSDIDYLSQLRGNNLPSLALHTNGVDMVPFVIREYNPMKIVFLGNMRTLQNQDAVLHFAKDIFPIIKKQKPEAQFYVIGAQPGPRIRKLAEREDIHVTGFVENLYPAMADACISVAPVKVAAGIQNKVLMAMSYGIPCIMTSLIAKAIPELRNEENCLISDKCQPFADACLSLMDNPQKRNMIAQKGYEMVEKHYSWKEKLGDYEIMETKR